METGRLGSNPTLFESDLNNVLFDLLDGYGCAIDVKDARCFAGRGANSSSEFRKIVGGMELANRVLPSAPVHKVIPIGNHVVDRTPGVAEGYATIHTTRGLFPLLFFPETGVDLEPVLEKQDVETVYKLIERHQGLTGSARAAWILDHWADFLPKFVKVFPHELKRVLGVAGCSSYHPLDSIPGPIAASEAHYG